MGKTIKAKFRNGVIEPLEKLELAEGEEINIAILTPVKTEKTLEAIRSTSGAWKGTIDAEELKGNIYADRVIKTRPEPKL